MNFSNHTFQQEFTQFKAIPSRLKSGTDGRTSAQSPLAHSDEDWTLIADMTERRKIQNRIAQRNYRRRIKERLSRLEKHASRAEKSSKQEKKPQDQTDQSHHTDLPQPQVSHKDILPLRVTIPNESTIAATPSQTFQQQPNFHCDQSPFNTSYPLSPNILGAGYPDFLSLFGDAPFDYYPDSTQVWRRPTWP